MVSRLQQFWRCLLTWWRHADRSSWERWILWEVCTLYMVICEMYLHTSVEFSYESLIPIPFSFLKKNTVHMAHHEGNMCWVGLQGSICRYALLLSCVQWKYNAILVQKWKYLCFYSGFMPRVIKVAPACAIMISTYEFGKASFRKANLDREWQTSWRLSLRRWVFLCGRRTLLSRQLGQGLLTLVQDLICEHRRGFAFMSGMCLPATLFQNANTDCDLDLRQTCILELNELEQQAWTLRETLSHWLYVCWLFE